MSGGSLLRYTVSGTLRRESPLPAADIPVDLTGPEPVPFFASSAFAVCYRFRLVTTFVSLLISSCYCLLPVTAFILSPPSAPLGRGDGDFSCVAMSTEFGFTLSRSVPDTV